MFVYRITKSKYASELSGKGAANSDNRWNSKGTEVIYTADSRALATVEVLVHLPMRLIPVDFVIMQIEIPDDIKVEIIKAKDLPKNWAIFPHLKTTQKIGDRFIETNKNAILKVPSAVVEGDFNYLIYPYYVDFKKISIKSVNPFIFNKRLFVR